MYRKLQPIFYSEVGYVGLGPEEFFFLMRPEEFFLLWVSLQEQHFVHVCGFLVIACCILIFFIPLCNSQAN